MKTTPANIYRLPDLPLTLEVARTWKPMSDEDAAHYLRVALHESAHVMACLSVGGCVCDITIRPRRTTTDEYGGANIAGKLPEHDAFMSFAGYAWEELHGDTGWGSDDRTVGKQSDPENWERNLADARQYVVKADTAIRYGAAAILQAMPVNGLLEGKKLQKLLHWLKPYASSAPRRVFCLTPFLPEDTRTPDGTPRSNWWRGQD